MNVSIHVQINEYTKVYRSSFLEVKSPIMYVHSPPTVIKIGLTTCVESTFPKSSVTVRSHTKIFQIIKKFYYLSGLPLSTPKYTTLPKS